MVMYRNPVIFMSASCMGLGVNYLSYLVIQACRTPTAARRSTTNHTPHRPPPRSR